MRVGLLLTAATAAALALSPAAHPASKSATCGKLLAPSSGIYLGADPDFVSAPHELEGDTVRKEAVDDFARLAGRRPVVAAFVQHWFEGLAFPRDKVMTVWRAGSIPYVRMWPHAGSPVGNDNPPEQYPGPYSLQNIIDGKFDAQLRAWADAARDSNIPLVLEFGDEENADWGPWGGIWNGGGDLTGYGDPTFPDGPERFRDAYRHLVALFRNEGATNVTWVFHMVQWFAPNRPWETFANYYPGNDYVDWLALSVFGEKILPDGGLASFEQILSTFHASDYPGIYADITSLGDKPLTLQYVGVSERQGDMAPWIRGMFDTLASGRYPKVAMMSWFNSRDFQSRLDSTPAAMEAFGAGAAAPLFAAKPQLSGNCLPGKPTVVRRRGRHLSWSPLPNATAYEVWRAGRRVATTAATNYVGGSGKYRVRGLNPLGAGPFATTR
jgi:glycosyl hydrolase family 26